MSFCRLCAGYRRQLTIASLALLCTVILADGHSEPAEIIEQGNYGLNSEDAEALLLRGTLAPYRYIQMNNQDHERTTTLIENANARGSDAT